MVALILLIGLSTGVAIAAAAGARRTDTAYDRFLESSRSATHRVAYTPAADIDGEVLSRLRADPEVEEAVLLNFFIGFSEASEFDIAVVSSPDEAFLRDIDRLRVVDGRLPSPGAEDEVMVNELLARSAGIGPGDRLPLATFTPQQLDDEDFEAGPQGPLLDLEVVGVGRIPDDLADDQNAYAFAGSGFFEAGDGRVGAFGPDLDLILRPGADAPATVERAFEGLAVDEPPVLEGVERRSDRVRDAVSVLSTGLLLFAACAALAALVTASQALTRRLADRAPDQAVLEAMGATRGQRIAAAVLSAAPIVIAGALLAVGVAVIGSRWMPIGIARRAEPSPGVDADWARLGLGAFGVTVVLLVTVAASARRFTRSARHRAAHPASAPLRRSTGAAVADRAGWSPPAVLGITMALEPGRGRTAVPVRPALIGAVAGVAGVVAALTFGASLGHLVDTPAAYGFNWQLSPDLFAGDPERLADRSEVEDLGLLSFRQTIIEGEDITGLAVLAVKGNPSLTVLDGRMPTTSGEVALGPKTMDQLDVSIGDHLDAIGADDEPLEVEVVGEVLFPTFDDNPFNEGVAFHPDLAVDVAESEGFGQAMVTFRPGIDRDRAVEIAEEVAPESVTVYAHPSRPPDVANLAQVRRIPLALAAFLVVLALAAVAHALVTAVRRRRRDIGIVRALGFRTGQVRGAVEVQAATLAVVGLLAGVPLGLVIGRTAWSLVASGLGVGTSPRVPAIALVALVPLTLVAAALAGLLPARSAARIRIAEALAAE
jgi:hypothetical protein